jgi:hypothetical protein
MNNTTKRTTLAAAIILIFTAAALVVGTVGTFTTTTGQSAYAYSKKDNGKGNGNGNTVTIQKCKQLASESGWDNNQEQECQNLICTHPGNNSTCVEEGVVTPTPTPPTPTPTPKACEECFTSRLNPTQISAILEAFGHFQTLADLCATIERAGGAVDESIFINSILIPVGIRIATANDLIACLKDVGVVFVP